MFQKGNLIAKKNLDKLKLYGKNRCLEKVLFKFCKQSAGKNLSKISSCEKLHKGRKMIISQKQNILYKDRMSHKHKPFVTDAQLSPNQAFQKTPLKRDVRDISFKGAFSLYNLKKYDLKSNLNLLERFIGKAPKRLEANFDKVGWADIREHIKNVQGEKVEVATKNWTRLLMEGVVYPVAELPLYIVNSVKKAFTGKGFVSNCKTMEEMNNRSWLQKKFDILNNSDIVNSFSGYMETAEKLKHDTKEVQSANLFTKAMKMFDPKTGNYNGVHERALTRIVTGFIPAFFLANDAYNLSRICDDDPNAADKERKTRFNQETKRVLSNAYLQLITLGALSKYINSKKSVFMLVTGLSVIATEAFSRLSNGKKITFINKEQALKLNEELAQKEGKELPQIAGPQNAQNIRNAQAAAPKPANSQLSFKGSKVFQGFGFASDIPFTSAGYININQSPSKNSIDNSIKEQKPLLSFTNVATWFVGVIAAGFAMKYAKKHVKINGATLEKYFNVISKKYNKIYDKITTKNYIIKKQEFEQVVAKLKKYEPTFGQKFEEVALRYQKTAKLNSEALNIAKTLEESGLQEYAEKFRHIANKGLNNRISDIGINSKAEAFFNERSKHIIEANLNDMFKLIEDQKLSEGLRKIIFEDGKLNLKNYTKAKKFIENHNSIRQFSTTFENRFKVDHEAENLKLFKEAMNALKEKNAQKAADFEDMINNAVNADELTLGKRNKKAIREAADFITQPFKFIWGTITLPYKHVAKPLSNAIKQEYPLPQWDKELDAVYNGINKLTYKPKFRVKFDGKLRIDKTAKIDLPDDKFAEYMDLRFNKALNAATMSSISNSDLSALAKNTSTAATAWFLLADNHNMVMQKSNGEDKPGAVLKAKERAIQELSRTFYNVLFINLFNDTFRNTYNSSLFGAQSVNVASTLIGEYTNRKAIGMPVKQSSRDEILNKEYENITSKGAKGEFFRFMSRLTGKKVLSQRENNKK